MPPVATRALTLSLSLRLRSQSEPNGWNARVLPTLTAQAVQRVSATQLDVSVPRASAYYEITQPETISLQLPAAVLQSERDGMTPLDPSSLIILADPGTASLSGSLLTAAEGVLLSGSSKYHLTIRLTGGEFESAERLPTEQVLASVRSLQAEPNGWNAVVLPALLARQEELGDVVTRQSDTAVLLTIHEGISDYAITAPETIRVRLAADTMKARQVLTPTEAVVVYAEPGTASAAVVEGTATDEAVRGPDELLLVIDLQDDVWVGDRAPTPPPRFRDGPPDLTLISPSPSSHAHLLAISPPQVGDLGQHMTDTFTAGVVPTAATSALLESILAFDGSPQHGWNPVVRPALISQYRRVRRINDTRVTLRLPACPRYWPGGSETIRITLLPATVRSSCSIRLHPRPHLSSKPNPKNTQLGPSRCAPRTRFPSTTPSTPTWSSCTRARRTMPPSRAAHCSPWATTGATPCTRVQLLPRRTTCSSRSRRRCSGTPASNPTTRRCAQSTRLQRRASSGLRLFPNGVPRSR